MTSPTSDAGGGSERSHAEGGVVARSIPDWLDAGGEGDLSRQS